MIILIEQSVNRSVVPTDKGSRVTHPAVGGRRPKEGFERILQYRLAAPFAKKKQKQLQQQQQQQNRKTITKTSYKMGGSVLQPQQNLNFFKT